MAETESNDRQAFLTHLRRARQAVQGTQGVLDRMLAMGADAAERQWVCDAMAQHAGVVGVVDVALAQASLHWESMSLAQAQGLRCLPLRLPGEAMTRVGLADPWDDAHLRQVAQALGHVPQLAAVTNEVLERCLGAVPQAAVPVPVPVPVPMSGSVVNFVDGAIIQALDLGASDIHFECDREGVAVKFRLDGVMVAWQRMESKGRAEEAISRIKVLAQLDITERRVPQDGRFRWQLGANGVDLRVSIMPSIHGEDAVLRLLDKAQLRVAAHAPTLDALGFSSQQARQIRELAALPHGMLLVTGPTGSGKTTTVYATLSEINTGLEKIVTIEDPVEYELPGVLQIPVNERKGLTFARGLRSILRHDPDRILVGEIRDAETAEIAVQSALTGHQVLTTVHANSIFDVVGRFRHFGLDMFGFVSSLNGLIVQRLLRRRCAACGTQRQPSLAERAWLDTHHVACEWVWRATGCQQCRTTGYRGRLVVAEVHVVDDVMRDLVTAGASMSALRQRVGEQAVSSLAQQGAQLVADGATTLEELRRVVGWI